MRHRYRQVYLRTFLICQKGAQIKISLSQSLLGSVEEEPTWGWNMGERNRQVRLDVHAQCPTKTLIVIMTSEYRCLGLFIVTIATFGVILLPLFCLGGQYSSKRIWFDFDRLNKNWTIMKWMPPEEDDPNLSRSNFLSSWEMDTAGGWCCPAWATQFFGRIESSQITGYRICSIRLQKGIIW